MGITSIIGSVIGLIGTGISGIFGLKKAQADTIQGAVKVLGDVNSSEGEREAALAAVITAEATSSYWLAAVWRPMMMVVFMIMILSFWFGYVPPHLLGPMPPMVAELFGLIKIGIGGYIGGRTLEKIVNSMNIGKILKQYVEKKIL